MNDDVPARSMINLLASAKKCVPPVYTNDDQVSVVRLFAIGE